MAEALLRKFRPTASNPWDYAKAAHLLNRAGFGGRPEEIDRLVRVGVEAAVNELVDFETIPDTPMIIDFSEIYALLEEAQRARQAGADERTRIAIAQRLQRANFQKLQETRESWVSRMIQTKRPLQEKMVFFWHGHLVSGYPEVTFAEHLYIQNELFRRMALGNYKELILAIARDPAMLTYLDNHLNRKGKPNENFGRALLEMFTMGIGNYTEQDVKEDARAFTGWAFRGTEFFFNRAQHDDGVKTFLGVSGNFDGTDNIDIIFQQPATARWLPFKLFEFFAYLRPEERVIDDLAVWFKATNFSVRAVVRRILESELFYSPQAIRAQVKSPVHLVVGSIRLLDGEQAPVRPLLAAMDQMGQALLFPPNVGGWPKGESWITTATILVRYNFSGLLMTGRMPGLPRRAGAQALDATRFVTGRPETAGEVLEQLTRRLLHRSLDGRRQFGLLRTVGANRPTDPFLLDGPASAERLRTLTHMIMSMPEYQLA